MAEFKAALKAACGLARKCSSSAKRAVALLKPKQRKQYRDQKQLETCGGDKRLERETARSASTSKDVNRSTDEIRRTSTAKSSRSDVGPASIQITPELVGAFKEAVVADRDAELVEAHIRAKIDALQTKFDQLDRSISDMDYQAEMIVINGVQAEQDKVAPMRQRVQEMRTLRDEVEEQQEQLQHDLADARDGQLMEQSSLIAALEDMLVRNRLLSSRPDVRAVQPPVSPTRNSLPASSSASLASINRHSSRSIGRREGSSDLQNDAVELSTTVRPYDTSDEPVVDPEEELLNSYKFSQLCVGQAEADFDNRQEQFDREYDELRQAIAAGETTDTLYDLDMRQIQETQRLTQQFAEAEAEYFAAKEAVMAAGVRIPGSQVESGFVNDVEDGYRLSFEQEMAESFEPAGMQHWVDGLPDVFDNDITTAASATEDCTDAIEREIDEWDAESVGIWESSSMKAEGPWRRRIDKWKAVCSRV